jgi:hypothetical protein
VRLTPDCPNCAEFADGLVRHAAGDGWKVTVFILDGTTHAVPSMWLASALMQGGESADSAMVRWAWHCGVENAKSGADASPVKEER